MAQKKFLIDAGFQSNGDSIVQGNLSITGTPSASTDAATKAYVDSAVLGGTTTATTDMATETFVNAADAVLQGNIDIEAAARASGDTSALSSANSYTDTAIANLVATAPATMDTLNELAAALGDDPNFATTVSNQIGTKADSSYVASLEARIAALEATLANVTAVTGGIRVSGSVTATGDVTAYGS